MRTDIFRDYVPGFVVCGNPRNARGFFGIVRDLARYCTTRIVIAPDCAECLPLARAASKKQVRVDYRDVPVHIPEDAGKLAARAREVERP